MIRIGNKNEKNENKNENEYENEKEVNWKRCRGEDQNS